MQGAVQLRSVHDLDDAENFLNIWHLITRLGEVQIVLPAHRTDRERIGGAVINAKTCTELDAAHHRREQGGVYRLGRRLGRSRFHRRFRTCHAMFVAAVYPMLMLMLALASNGSPSGRGFSFALGGALALAVGLSRIAVGAHSWSEVWAGLLVGSAVSTAALVIAKRVTLPMRPLVSAALFTWLVAAPFQLHALQTHALVTRLAVAMSGNAIPFRRSELAHRLRHIHFTAHPGA
jgi:hypothetical protein